MDREQQSPDEKFTPSVNADELLAMRETIDPDLEDRRAQAQDIISTVFPEIAGAEIVRRSGLKIASETYVDDEPNEELKLFSDDLIWVLEFAADAQDAKDEVRSLNARAAASSLPRIEQSKLESQREFGARYENILRRTILDGADAVGKERLAGYLGRLAKNDRWAESTVDALAADVAVTKTFGEMDGVTAEWTKPSPNALREELIVKFNDKSGASHELKVHVRTSQTGQGRLVECRIGDQELVLPVSDIEDEFEFVDKAKSGLRDLLPV